MPSKTKTPNKANTTPQSPGQKRKARKEKANNSPANSPAGNRTFCEVLVSPAAVNKASRQKTEAARKREQRQLVQARDSAAAIEANREKAEAEATRQQAEADAEAARKQAEADAEAEAARQQAEADAEAARKQAEADAEAARQQAEAEAETARQKAEAEAARQQAMADQKKDKADKKKADTVRRALARKKAEAEAARQKGRKVAEKQFEEDELANERLPNVSHIYYTDPLAKEPGSKPMGRKRRVLSDETKRVAEEDRARSEDAKRQKAQTEAEAARQKAEAEAARQKAEAARKNQKKRQFVDRNPEDENAYLAHMNNLLASVRCDAETEKYSETECKRLRIEAQKWVEYAALFLLAILRRKKCPRRSDFKVHFQRDEGLADEVKSGQNWIVVYDRLKRATALAIFLYHLEDDCDDNSTLRKEARGIVRDLTKNEEEKWKDTNEKYDRMLMYAVFVILSVIRTKTQKPVDYKQAVEWSTAKMSLLFPRNLRDRMILAAENISWWEEHAVINTEGLLDPTISAELITTVGAETQEEEEESGSSSEAEHECGDSDEENGYSYAINESDDDEDRNAAKGAAAEEAAGAAAEEAAGAAAEGAAGAAAKKGLTFNRNKPPTDHWTEAKPEEKAFHELYRLIFCNNEKAIKHLPTVDDFLEYLLLRVLEDPKDLQEVKKAIADFKTGEAPGAAGQETAYSELAECVEYCEQVWNQFLNLHKQIGKDLKEILKATTELMKTVSTPLNLNCRKMVFANVYSLVLSSVQKRNHDRNNNWAHFTVVLAKFFADFTNQPDFLFKDALWTVLQDWELVAPFASIKGQFLSFNLTTEIKMQEPFPSPDTTGNPLKESVLYTFNVEMENFHKLKDAQREKRWNDEVAQSVGLRYAAEGCIVMYRPGTKGRYFIGPVARMNSNSVTGEPFCRILPLLFNEKKQHRTVKFTVVEGGDKVVRGFRGDETGDPKALKLRTLLFSQDPEQMMQKLTPFYLARILMHVEEGFWTSHIRIVLMLHRKMNAKSSHSSERDNETLHSLQKDIGQLRQKLHVSSLHIEQYFNKLKTLVVDMLLFASKDENKGEKREIIRFWMEQCPLMDLFGMPRNSTAFKESGMTVEEFKLLMSHTERCTDMGIMPSPLLGSKHENFIEALKCITENTGKNKGFKCATPEERNIMIANWKYSNSKHKAVVEASSDVCSVSENPDVTTWQTVFDAYRCVLETKSGKTTTALTTYLIPGKHEDKLERPDCSALPVSSNLKIPIFSLEGDDDAKPTMQRLPNDMDGFYPHNLSWWNLMVKVHLLGKPGHMSKKDAMEKIGAIKTKQKEVDSTFIDPYIALLDELKSNFDDVVKAHATDDLKDKIAKYQKSKPVNTTTVEDPAEDPADDSDDQPLNITNQKKKKRKRVSTTKTKKVTEWERRLAAAEAKAKEDAAALAKAEEAKAAAEAKAKEDAAALAKAEEGKAAAEAKAKEDAAALAKAQEAEEDAKEKYRQTTIKANLGYWERQKSENRCARIEDEHLSVIKEVLDAVGAVRSGKQEKYMRIGYKWFSARAAFLRMTEKYKEISDEKVADMNIKQFAEAIESLRLKDIEAKLSELFLQEQTRRANLAVDLDNPMDTDTAVENSQQTVANTTAVEGTERKISEGSDATVVDLNEYGDTKENPISL